MAIFHAHVNVISRSAGHSALAAAAYRAAENIGSHQYAKRGGVHGSEILYPEDAPKWVKALSRAELWQSVEDAERRKDAQLARAGDFALPRELDWQQKEQLTKEFVHAEFTRRGMIVDVAYHDGHDNENDHFHLLATMRRAEESGWGKKERSWNDKAFLEALRKGWEEHVNAALERAGIDARIDHRSLAAQGIDRAPQVHRGKYRANLEREGRRMDAEISQMEKERAALVAEIEQIELTSSPTAEGRTTAPATAEPGQPAPPIVAKAPQPTAPSADYYARKAARLAAQRADAEAEARLAAGDHDNQVEPNATDTPIQAGQALKDARTALLKIAWRVHDKKPAFVQAYNNAQPELKYAIDDILTTNDTAQQRQKAEKHLQSLNGADIAKTVIALRQSAELSR